MTHVGVTHIGVLIITQSTAGDLLEVTEKYRQARYMINSMPHVYSCSFDAIHDINTEKDECKIILKNKKLKFKTPHVSIQHHLMC